MVFQSSIKAPFEELLEGMKSSAAQVDLTANARHMQQMKQMLSNRGMYHSDRLLVTMLRSICYQEVNPYSHRLKPLKGCTLLSRLQLNTSRGGKMCWTISDQRSQQTEPSTGLTKPLFGVFLAWERPRAHWDMRMLLKISIHIYSSYGVTRKKTSCRSIVGWHIISNSSEITAM